MAEEGSLDSFLTPSVEQFQRVRQSKGNQELNDELKMKAKELEKLFAEHKLRTSPGNQSKYSTSRSTRHCHMQSWPSATSSSYTSPVRDNAFVQDFENYTFTEPVTPASNITKVLAENQSCVGVEDHMNSSDELISLAKGSPGKFYDMYMRKRDAKLREEWNSKGAEKEAKLKAMKDSLERSRAEMQTNFAASTDRDNNMVSTARRHSERLGSFNSSSFLSKDQEQQSAFAKNDDREDMPEFSKQKRYDELSSFEETSFAEEVPKSTQKKKHLPIKTSSKPRSIVASVPRSPMKLSSSPSSRRKSQLDSPLARSVPNFFYMRKENADPSSPASKTTRLQSRNYSHTKGTMIKLLRSHSLRKSSAKVGGLKEMGVNLAPIKLDKDKMEQSLSDEYPNNSNSKTSLEKGKDAYFSSGVGFTKTRASIASKFEHNDEEDNDMELDSEDSDCGNDQGFENMTSAVEDNFDNETPKLSDGTDKLVNSGSENGNVPRPFSQVGYASDCVWHSSVPSNFLSGRYLQESPGDSPVSWNSRAHCLSSYTHEMSDIGASDSPVGSPASLSSHFQSQMESDAAKTRKKWGVAQKPIYVVKSSQSQSRKDKARGFKRLLSFGNKNHGADSLVDWISATTSKGNDGTGNGHDSPNRSSNHQTNPSNDSLYEDEFFNERVQSPHSYIPAPPANFKLREDHLSGSSIKAPRSFFSFSSFRSKGKDSKPR